VVLVGRRVEWFFITSDSPESGQDFLTLEPQRWMRIREALTPFVSRIRTGSARRFIFQNHAQLTGAQEEQKQYDADSALVLLHDFASDVSRAPVEGSQ
jgi:hypothetical protein